MNIDSGSMQPAKQDKTVLVWGFCSEFNCIVDYLRTSKSAEVFHVSDGPASELNIHDCFFRKMPRSVEQLRVREGLAGHFSTFKELYSRHWYPMSISDEEYLKYFNSYIDYFTELFSQKKFTLAVFSNIPHEGPDYVAYLVADHFSCKRLVFFQGIFESRSFVSDNIDVFNKGLLRGRGLASQTGGIESAVDVAMQSVGKWAYMEDVSENRDLSFAQAITNARGHFKKSPSLMLKLFLDAVRFYFEYKKCRVISLPTKEMEYIYFPLHLQPELTTSILGNGYSNQLAAIKELADKCSGSIEILVKENPKQSAFMRPPGYYEELTSIPGVRLLSTGYSTLELIKGALAVATVTGTVGWEALCFAKPVITFGKCWYREFAGVHPFVEIENFADVFNERQEPLKKGAVVDLLRGASIEGCVDPAYTAFQSDFSFEKNTQDIGNFILNYLDSL